MPEDTTNLPPNKDWGDPNRSVVAQSGQRTVDAGAARQAPSDTTPPPMPMLSGMQSLFTPPSLFGSAPEPDNLRAAISDFLRNNVTINGSQGMAEGGSINFNVRAATPQSTTYDNQISVSTPTSTSTAPAPVPEPHPVPTPRLDKVTESKHAPTSQPETPRLDAHREENQRPPESKEERNERVHKEAQASRDEGTHKEGERIDSPQSSSRGVSQSDVIGFMSKAKFEGESDKDYANRQSAVAGMKNLSYSERQAAIGQYQTNKTDAAHARGTTYETYKLLIYTGNQYITLDSSDSTLMMKDSSNTTEVLLSGGTDPEMKLFDGANTGKYGPVELYLDNANGGSSVTLTADGTPELILFDGTVSVKLDIPDNNGTKLEAYWQEIDVCVEGAAMKMQVLGTTPY